MQDWQIRVVAEKEELDLRLKNLRVFMTLPEYRALQAWEQALLVRQETVMLEYSRVLGERIFRFGNVEVA